MKKSITYKKRYKIRLQGPKGLNTIVSIPRVVIEREAERCGLKFDEFIKEYRAVAHFDNIEGILYTFEKEGNEAKR